VALDFARVGRTLLSDAFDVDLVFDFDLAFDVDREGHGLSRADNEPEKWATTTDACSDVEERRFSAA
jgi:hypothetical protein